MLESFRPLLDAAQGVDLADAEAARAVLEARLPSRGAAAAALDDDLRALLQAGRVAQRGELPVRYGRVAKASAESSGFSIDVVLMTGAGPRHTHPLGEVNWCVPLEGDPRFEGTRHGWVVMTPGSQHVPAVSGGTMLIVYLLPQGQIEFHA